MILTTEAIKAISVLCGRILAYNQLLNRANDPESCECIQRLTLTLHNIKAAWASVCDGAMDLKKISGYNVVLGGKGAVYHGYIRCAQAQLLDTGNNVVMQINIDYPDIFGPCAVCGTDEQQAKTDIKIYV